MRILDINNNEIKFTNFESGYLKKENLFIEHHKAKEFIKEQGHYEVIAEYPNGGKDVKWVIDVEGQQAQEAWDEYEEILRYYAYTEEELKKIEEEKNKPSQLEIFEAQLIYTAIMTGTFLEV